MTKNKSSGEMRGRMDTEALLAYVSAFLDREEIRTGEPMSLHTSFGVGGTAEVFLRAENEEKLSRLMAYLHEHQLPYFVLGNGSNLLVSDKGFRGVIVALGEGFRQIRIEGNSVHAGAAALLGTVAKEAMEAGLRGLEFASGIPGSLGGGMVMNAGAYGGDLGQVVTRVRAMNEQGGLVLFEKEKLDMGYRTSRFKKNRCIVLEAALELFPGKKEEILEKMREYNRQRHEKQPLEYKSAGSTFKRPGGHFAGKLIMEAGLRGFRVGDAQISEKHCGFVINRGRATAEDICALMRRVQAEVKRKFGVELEPEVIFLGDP